MSDEKLVLRVEKPGGMVLIEMEAITRSKLPTGRFAALISKTNRKGGK